MDKNTFSNIFNTSMDIKSKTKDNANAMEDLKLIYNRLALELVMVYGKGKKPKAMYALSATERENLYVNG